MIRIAIPMIAALTLAGCAASAPRVTHDYDKTADFRAYKTYTWIRGTDLRDTINHQRIVAAIDAQLALKGLTRINSGADPDLLVAYHAAFDRNLRIDGFSSGWDGPRFGGSRAETARVDKVLIGILAVEMVDAKKHTIAWRGVASKEIDVDASPGTRESNIHGAAQAIFASYPPVESGVERP